MKYFSMILFIMGCATAEKIVAPVKIDACLVVNPRRGKPVESEVEKIVAGVEQLPDSAFAWNSNYDIYAHMEPKFSAYTSGLIPRKALMAAVLTNLAGWESNWDWTEGVDVTNMASMSSKCQEEAGIFQTSADSMTGFSPELRQIFNRECRAFTEGTECERFIACTKANHEFAVTYTARLLRDTTNHHGPIKRKTDVYSSLSTACVEQLKDRFSRGP